MSMTCRRGGSTTAEPLLSLAAITKRFGSFPALSTSRSTSVPGEMHCMLGENGAGKSTLCNLIFGVHRPDQGSMRYRGAPLSSRGTRGRARATASPWCTSISAWCPT